MIRTNARRFLDDWRFWMGVAYFGLILVICALWINYDRVNADAARTARIVAARHAEVVANADSQYQQCVQSGPVFSHVNKFIFGVEAVEQALLTNTETTHRATPPGSAIYATQTANIARLRDAIQAARLVAFPVPTATQCRALRARLMRRQ
jgi:hypothetical protein